MATETFKFDVNLVVHVPYADLWKLLPIVGM
ncbi:hypothetical protein predicted by Glimmer/Critica [Lactiplantibacillus plantarum]|nr:hypothetical protein predicted by Glimmer/Critica [Lactiplantibacillus plantarum]